MDHSIWLFRAAQDVRAYEILLKDGEGPWSVISSLAHQAAEKYLKAYLAFKGAEFPRSHDLTRLLSIARGYDPGLEYLKNECSALSEHAVQSRYPDSEDEFDRSVAIDAVEYSRLIGSAILERI